MKKRFSLGLAAFVGLVLVASTAQASITFDQNITAIYGSGNADTNWTTDTNGGVTLGLRAKVRYDVVNNLPDNVFNSLGNGTYVHAAGSPPSNPDRARWNFEWSINSGSSRNLNQLTYKLEIDFNPGWGTTYLAFDPITQTFADHSIGNNATLNGQGVEAANSPAYLALINSNNIAQNSWNMAFFDFPASPYLFNPAVNARYSFRLSAYETDENGPSLVAQTFMHVMVGDGVVPEPTSLLSFGGLMLVGLGFTGRRRAK